MNNIKILELSKLYRKRKVLDNINLSVEEHESFGLISPNQVGITTMIKILLNFTFPTKGKTMVMGLDSIKDTVKIKSLVSYMPTNIKLSGMIRAKTLIEKLIGYYNIDKTNYNNIINNLSTNLKLNINLQLKKMTRTELRKLWVIITFLNNPKLIFLENPTNDLDPFMKSVVVEFYKEYKNKGNSLFIASNDLECITCLCDRIGIFNKGHILFFMDLRQFSVNDITTVKSNILKEYNRVVYGDENFNQPN